MTLILSSSSPAHPMLSSILPWLLSDAPYHPAPGPSVRESNSHPAIIRFAGVAAVSVSNFVSVSLATCFFSSILHPDYISLTYTFYISLPQRTDLSIRHSLTLCSCSLSPAQKLASMMEQINPLVSEGPAELASNSALLKNSLSLKLSANHNYLNTLSAFFNFTNKHCTI